ncbi:ACP phosphodiesterase [Algiphilus sp.]|uniref:ACP phosphodiesterase n=1 Tax=Algiphilus sp. TaxID=1872431 RepID=UPI003B5228C2
MNFLAHLYIAEQRAADPAGAVLGDVVRGRDLSHLPEAVAHSIRLHRRIDAVCDRHPSTRQALQQFPVGPRRYAGIVLDLCADHLLARDWAQWHRDPLTDFCQAQAQAIAANSAAFAAIGRPPPQPERFAAILADCAALEGIDRALQRISQRARDPKRLLAATRHWRRHLGALEDGFAALLRDCIAA